MAVLSLLLACGVALSNVSTPISNVKTIDNTSQSISMESTGDDSSTPYIPPDKRDREIYEDYYEPNGLFNDAINMCPDDYYDQDIYYSRANSMLEINRYDTDIFYFTILTDSNVSIKIQAIDDCTNGYDDDDSLIFCLQYYENLEINSDNESGRIVYSKFEDATTKKEKNYYDLLQPGTYFILLQPQESYSYTANLNYIIDLSVQKTPGYSDENINDLRYNKKLPGAVWLSDYVPINYKSAFDLSLVANYYQYGIQNLSDKNFALDSLDNISGDKDIHMASVYIWDEVLKGYLNTALTSMYDSLVAYSADNTEVISSYNSVYDVVKDCITWSGYVAGVLVPSLGGSIAVNFLSEASILALECIFDVITPKFDVIPSTYMSYLSTLYGFMEADSGCEGNVIEIPIYYNIESVNLPGFSSYTKKLIDFTPTITKMLPDGSNSFRYINY